jgi:hypothetical protein
MSNELFPNKTQIPKYSQMSQVVYDGSIMPLIHSFYADLAPQTETDKNVV